MNVVREGNVIGSLLILIIKDHLLLVESLKSVKSNPIIINKINCFNLKKNMYL